MKRILLLTVLLINYLFAGEPGKQPCEVTVLPVETQPVYNDAFIVIDTIKVEYVPVLVYEKKDSSFQQSKFGVSINQFYYQNDKTHSGRSKYDLFVLLNARRRVYKAISLGMAIRYNNNNHNASEGFYGLGMIFTKSLGLSGDLSVGYYRVHRLYRESKLNKKNAGISNIRYRHKIWKAFSFVGSASYEMYVSSNEFNPMVGIGVSF